MGKNMQKIYRSLIEKILSSKEQSKKQLLKFLKYDCTLNDYEISLLLESLLNNPLIQYDFEKEIFTPK